jgi:hypothetical protein
MKKPPSKTTIIFSVLLFLYLAFYTVATPYIKGIVVDATTRKPVENAWVMVSVGLVGSSPAGGVGSTHAISSPHTRTDRNGVFTVRPRMFFTAPVPPPLSFGAYGGDLTVMVRVADGRRAEVKTKAYHWIWPLSVTIPVKYEERKIEDTRDELSKLSGYCIGGMYFPIHSPGASCDEWEINFVIGEYEKLIKSFTNLQESDQREYYPSALYSLALLHRKKGDYQKALDLVEKAKRFDLEKHISWDIAKYNRQIKELEAKLKEK